MTTDNGSEPISAIHGRETQTGSWSGSGIMLGTGGLGYGLGLGSVDTQTIRAREFAPPTVSRLAGFVPGIVLLVFAFVLGQMPDVMLFAVRSLDFTADGQGADPAWIAKIVSFVRIGVFILAFVAFVSGVVKVIGPIGQKVMADADALDEKQMKIYNRLRLDEKTNRVFDPDSGLSSAADRSSILGLISRIIDDQKQSMG